MRSSSRAPQWTCLLLAVLACASVDFDHPKSPSYAPNGTEETRLGRLLVPLVRGRGDESGFNLLLDGIDALAARLAMATMAERSLDAQYFLITDDVIGMLFIGSLLDAADRGVRVRFLLDDIQTSGYDAGMAGLDSHENLEVRVFNPFADRSTRVGDVLTDFRRINRRMHNKSFTADNQVTIVGGRNIAAEYFNAAADVNFGDADVLGIGPVVRDVSTMFDAYWNDSFAVPIPGFAKLPADPAAELVRLRGSVDEARRQVAGTRWAEAMGQSIDAYIGDEVEDGDDEFFTWAPYQLIYDSPDKARRETAEEADSIMDPLIAAIESAKREFVLVSPYFVPQKSGIEYFAGLRGRGIEVVVVTNSLASTNHKMVHSGYAPARKPLLQAGVRLYEMKPEVFLTGIERSDTDSISACLHTKAFLVDGERLFLGSFNWDPRSVYINTELGVIIESPEMAAWAVQTIHEEMAEVAYEVVLDEKGRIRWIDSEPEEPVVFTTEPETSFWQRFYVGFMRILPIESQL